MNEIYRIRASEFQMSYGFYCVSSARKYDYMHALWNGLKDGEVSTTGAVRIALYAMQCVQNNVKTDEDRQSRPAVVTKLWLDGFWKTVVCDILKTSSEYLAATCINNKQKKMFNNLNVILERDCAGELLEIEGNRGHSYAWETDAPGEGDNMEVVGFKHALNRLHETGGFCARPSNIWENHIEPLATHNCMRTWGYAYAENLHISTMDAVRLSENRANREAMNYIIAQFNPFDYQG